MTDHIFQLPDGRQLGYSVFGPADGYPVLYFHGTPSSRLEPLLLAPYGKDIDELLLLHRLRLITIDRPGIGNSSHHSSASFLSFAKDVKALCDELQIASAAAFGWSGGGPYILSMAYHFPNLIKAVYIVAGFTRSFSEKEVFRKMTANRYYFGAARLIPRALSIAMKYYGAKPAKQPLPRWLSQWPAPDYKLMKDYPERMLAFSRATTMEAVKQGPHGVVDEARRYFDKPGYDIREIAQPLHYWWGKEDNVVQWVHAEAIKNHAPNHHIHVKQHEGHFSIYIHFIEEMLQAISSEAWPRSH